MPRSVNHVASRAKRKNMMKLAKGYFGRRKNVWTVAKNAIEKGLLYAYTGRKQKKRNFRSLWITRINAGARVHGMPDRRTIFSLESDVHGLQHVVVRVPSNAVGTFKEL